jgi:ATP-dependent helicase HrpB
LPTDLPEALPIDPLLPQIVAALQASGRVVLQAPPGAGKTTRVPLALLDHAPGRILMLEPRRLAARAAAERMAETRGEAVGQTIGYRIRGEARVSRATRIEVVTEGILTRMIQSDPDLPGVGAVIFDEFHERSLNADLGLALVLEAQAALRPDLWVVVMSATLDAAPVAALMDDAPILTATGRAFPVETRWLDRPVAAATPMPRAMADLILTALDQTTGGVLAFLPGEREIRRTAAALQDRLPSDVALQPLFGAMDFRAQRAALAPLQTGRKLVLATSIAETSLTIPDVRVVVDAGLARRARHDPGSGMSRLVTEPVSRAEAEQRRGRAGRVAPGTCFRLWTRGAEGALPEHPPAEIETADLTGMALDLALWGGAEGLRFLTPPPPGPMARARALLAELGALDSAERFTDHGRAMAALPLHPRLAHMLLRAGRGAATLAALTTDRDPLIGAPVDAALRLRALSSRGAFPARPEVLDRIRAEAARLARLAPPDAGLGLAQAAALAFPDRIARRRQGSQTGDQPRYLLSGGRGAVLDPSDPLAGAEWLVVMDQDGGGTEARIRLALSITEGEIRATLADRITTADTCDWSPREARILSRRQERLGALTMSDTPWTALPEARARAALAGLRDLGLAQCGMTQAARRLQARVELLRAQGADLPAFDDTSLTASAEDWALAHLQRVRSAEDLRALDLTEALRQHLGWDGLQTLDRLAPADFTTPLGRRVPIDYATGQPEITVRLQEMFGVTTHPTVGPRRLPLRVTLTSPAHHPLQTTTDLPGFWANSYADVRKDIRGRYPRHPWPEDPTQADPTLRAKPRGT